MFKKVSNETKIGALAAVSIAALIIGYNYLKGTDIFSSTNTFYARYSQLDGLDVSNPIKINGLAIGRVKQLRLAPGKSGQLIATFSINKEIKFPDNSIAEIASSDLLGSKEVDIILGNSDQYVKNGDTLQSNVQESLATSLRSDFTPVKAKTENLLVSLDSTITAINNVFNADTRKNLTSSIKSIEKTLKNLSSTTGTLDTLLKNNNSRLSQIFTNVESITNNLKNNNKQITELLTNFTAISDSLKRANIVETFDNARTSLQKVDEVMKKISTGQGTLGELVNDTKLYDNLNASAKSLNDLLIDFKAHPKNYVHFSIFGKKDKSTSTNSNPGAK